MRNRKVVAGLVACTAAGVCACWLYQSCLLVGWLRGEAFYLGRPTSYWGRELAYWDEPSLAISWVPSRRTVYRNEIALAVDLKAPAVATLNGWMVHLPYLIVPVDDPNHPARARADVSDTVWVDTSFYSRKPGLVDKLVGYFGVMFDNPDRPPVLTGDPAAEPVLRALLDDPSDDVRARAQEGLRLIQHARNYPITLP
jgi:hypothetical protein